MFKYLLFLMYISPTVVWNQISSNDNKTYFNSSLIRDGVPYEKGEIIASIDIINGVRISGVVLNNFRLGFRSTLVASPLIIDLNYIIKTKN